MVQNSRLCLCSKFTKSFNTESHRNGWFFLEQNSISKVSLHKAIYEVTYLEYSVNVHWRQNDYIDCLSRRAKINMFLKFPAHYFSVLS